MKRLLFILAFALASVGMRAQCGAENTAFQGGERLTYVLKFNWKFIWMTVGTAQFTIDNHNDGYRAHLITGGNKNADRMFVLRDTITSVVSRDLTPRYYRKGAHEGNRYTTCEAWYTYPGGKANVKQRFRNHKGEVKRTDDTSAQCYFDMVAMLLRARSFDAADYKVGQKIRFPMVDNGKVKEETIVYRGKKNFKMEGAKTKYRCLVFSFVEYKKGKEKEVVTFYITDDKNHLPVRLDLFLRFGSAKAFLTGATGVRNPQTAIIKK